MRLRFPELTFLTMDARKLDFVDASYGAVVDKGHVSRLTSTRSIGSTVVYMRKWKFLQFRRHGILTNCQIARPFGLHRKCHCSAAVFSGHVFFFVSLPSTRQLNNVDWPLLGAASCCCGRWKIAGSLEYRQSLFATQRLQGLCCHKQQRLVVSQRRLQTEAP